MDASNPIMSTDRVRLDKMAEKCGVRRRQDLAYLRRLTEASNRVMFSGAVEVTAADAVENYEDYVKGLALVKGKTPASSGFDTTNLNFLNYGKPFPVDNTKHDGVQIHPPTVHRKAGFVSTTRTFGHSTGDDPRIAKACAEVFTAQDLIAAGSEYVHSYGTPEGFRKRLEELMSRPCKRPYTSREVCQQLEKLLPVDATKIPDWNDIDAMIQRVQLTHSSSAGAPYWKSKREAYYECVETVLPEVIDAIGTGNLNGLFRAKPEWFLCEIKNKLDRYDRTKLKDKCRPYVAQPMHWSILFSALVQPFCGALKQWGDGSGYNAYGMSAMNGGLTKILERARKLHERSKKDGKTRYMVGCYGDDGKLIEIKPEGAQCIDPDFRQMDGSVDGATVRGVCEYIKKVYSEKHGEHGFWSIILDLLADFSVTPYFIIDGTQTFTKKSPDGILSGVVGTTLFDTAKAAIAYHDLVQQFKAGTNSIGNKARITSFMKTHHGLEIKEGTLTVAPFELYPEEGDFVCSNKFLGVRWIYARQELSESVEEVVVPHLYEYEWLTLLLTPRDDPHDQDITSTRSLSAFTRARRAFDRARGLLITGAVFSKNVAQALYRVVDETPGDVVIFQVEGGEGKGEVLSENYAIVGDFSYPSSSGCPTEEWVLGLYSTEDKVKMPEIYPTVLVESKWRQRIAGYKLLEKMGKPIIDIDEVKTQDLIKVEYDVTSMPPKQSLKLTQHITDPLPLQDKAEALAASIDKGYIPAARSMPITIASSALPTGHKGPVVGYIDKQLKVNLLKELFLYMKKQYRRETFVYARPGETILSVFQRLADANGLRVDWETDTMPGPTCNTVSLSLYDRMNPFEGGSLGHVSGSSNLKYLRSLLAEEFVAQWRAFMALYSQERWDEAALKTEMPKHGEGNPFSESLIETPIMQAVIPPPKASFQDAPIDGASWSVSVALEDLSQKPKPVSGQVLKELQDQIVKSYKTPYEQQRDKNKTRNKNGKEQNNECKDPKSNNPKCHSKKSPSKFTESHVIQSRSAKRRAKRSRGGTAFSGPSGDGHV